MCSIFLSSVQEALSALLDCAEQNRHLFDLFGASIAHDHGVSPELVTLAKVKELVGRMLKTRIGSRVEMRRWFTYCDAAFLLPSIWHTLLLGLIVQMSLEGKNPWAIMRDATPTVGEDDDQAKKNFAYKVEALKTLANDFNNTVLRSTVVCARRLRKHHAAYEGDHQNPELCFRYMLVWSSWRTWVRDYVVGVYEDAFFTPKRVQYVGLSSTYANTTIYGKSDQASEAAEVLFMHTRQCFAQMRELLLYAIQWTVPPWSCVNLLHPWQNERQLEIAWMKRVWEVVTRLRSSVSELHTGFLRVLFFTKWVVLTNPCKFSKHRTGTRTYPWA